MNETGKNKYSKDFKVPEEFPEILRYFSAFKSIEILLF